jgi:pyroglutamyl-peptidase
LLCGFGGFPNFPANPSGIIVEQLEAEGWAPEGASLAFSVLPTTWAGAVAALKARLRETGADGVLLTGVCGGAAGFRVEMRAQNRASTTAVDADGRKHGAMRISPLGPAVLRASAPVEPMIGALRKVGLPVEPSSDAGDYLCNYTFYKALADQASDREARPIAFLHLPPVREAPPVEDAGFLAFTLDDLEKGVKAAATSLARTLAFGSRETLPA